jgi:phytanoyl-CoA dioxygenase PhyH
MSTVIENLQSLLSAEDIAFYDEHGWFVAPNLLDDKLIDNALEGLHLHWAGHRDHILPGAGQYCKDWMPGDGDGTRNNEYLSLQSDRVRQLVVSPAIGAIAASLAKSPSVRLFDDQMIYKPPDPKNSVVGWHVDQDYRGTCSSDRMLTAWIPFEDCPEELGPLVVLDGSHRWSHKIDRASLSFHRMDPDALARQVNGLGYEFKPVTMALKRGQFSFHRCLTLHGSYPNRGTLPRVAIAAHLQDHDNSYRPALRLDGRPVVQFNDCICRRTPSGLPDYTDEWAFPTLWNPSAESCEG